MAVPDIFYSDEPFCSIICVILRPSTRTRSKEYNKIRQLTYWIVVWIDFRVPEHLDKSGFDQLVQLLELLLAIGKTSASASARTESAEQAQTQGQGQGQEPADAETPELAVSRLRQQFGIPAVKEDRDEEQQRRSMELNRAVMAMIREITWNNSARSLADLKSDMEKQEFIRRSLTLAYDGQKFEEIPF